MPWCVEACLKPATHCCHVVDPSIRLWMDVGLHHSPWKSGPKARAAVFVGCIFVYFRSFSWSLNDALGCCGVFEACLTLLAHCGPFGALFEGRWASPRPSKIGFKGKSGGVCGVSFCQLSALSWSLNDALGCQGASTACHILWSHRGPFDASLKKRWASLKPLEVRFKGKSGGVCGVPFRRLSALSWSLNDALVCLGMSRACHTFLKHHGLVFCVSGWTFSVTMDLGSPVLW